MALPALALPWIAAQQLPQHEGPQVPFGQMFQRLMHPIPGSHSCQSLQHAVAVNTAEAVLQAAPVAALPMGIQTGS